MGGFSDIFKTLNQNAEKLTNGEAFDEDALPQFGGDQSVGENYEVSFENSANPTRWEKAVMGLHGMVKQVSKVDPDGLDIVCFGGRDENSTPSKSSKSSKISVYRNVKNAKDVEKMVTSKLPSGPCNMGKAMDYVLKEAFDKGFKKRPCGILVLTAGCPDDSERLERSLQEASEKIARDKKYKKLKEPPLSVTFVHVGDDPKAEDYMQHLAKDIQSTKKSKKTGEVIDIVDTIKHRDIQAAMKEIKGTKSSGKTGAIIGAFAGAAMGVGGMYLYNKHQAKKRTKGWNGNWKATYEGCEIATLTVKDDMKGHISIDGFPGGKTNGRYAEAKNAYNITFRDADEHWRITGEIEDEHTIFWSDGTRWDEIPPKGGKWTHYAGAAVAGAATGGAIGYLLDKKFFKKCSKKDQCDYVIMVDRSAMMAIQDQTTMSGDDDDDEIEEYNPNQQRGSSSNTYTNNGYIQSATHKFNNLSTGEKVAVGVAGAAAVAGVAAAGVGIAHAVKSSGNKDKDAPVVTARAIESSSGSRSMYNGGFNGKWRSTYDGDTLAVLDVTDDRNGTLTIHGFMGGGTIGKYVRNNNTNASSHRTIAKINFIDADENWPVNGDVKGTKETVVIWEDGSRWDKIA